jgi:hypothetical protein
MDGATDVAEASPPPAPADTCRNCGARATGHFCPNCGQETRLTLPTFMAFMREAAGRYVAMDGRLWRTLAALVARPGFLTLEYLNGRRIRYVRPGRLFLVLYLLLFAVIGLYQSPLDLHDEVVFVDRDKAVTELKRELDKGTVDKEAHDAAMAILESGDGNTFLGLDKELNLRLRWNGEEVALPAQLRKRWDHFRKLSRDDKAERLYAGVLRYGPYAMVALLPAFALLLKLAYLGGSRRYPRRPQRYAEHLVYSAHVHAFAAIMILAFLLVPFAPVRFAIAAWIVFYAMRARQTVYRGRWWGGLMRALAIGILYFILLAVAMLGLLVVAIMLR